MSNALDDIEKALRMMRDRGAEMKAFEGLLTEISSALADILGHMEKPAEERAESKQMDALVAAVKGLSLKAPDVQITVQPAAVSMPAPTVTVMPSDWTSLKVKVSAPRMDGTKEFTITKA